MLDSLAPPYGLMASILCGSGLRLFELSRLRVKEVDFDGHVLVVREGKGGKDRRVPLRAAAPISARIPHGAPRSCPPHVLKRLGLGVNSPLDALAST